MASQKADFGLSFNLLTPDELALLTEEHDRQERAALAHHIFNSEVDYRV